MSENKIPKQKCSKCERELTKKQVVKIYEDKYRTWCVCHHENFYYKDWEKEYKEMMERERIKKEKEKKEKEVKENVNNENEK